MARGGGRSSLPQEQKGLADYCVREALKLGAQYAEARIHGGTGTGFMLKNGEPQPSVIDDSFGIATRIIVGGAMGFSATNLLSREKVRDMTARSIKMAKASSRLVKEPISMGEVNSVSRKVRVSEKEPIEGADPNWLKSLLLEIDKRVVGTQSGGVKVPEQDHGRRSGGRGEVHRHERRGEGREQGPPGSTSSPCSPP